MAPQGSPVSFLARADEGKVCVVSRTGIGGGARVPSAWTLLSEGSSLPVADERSNMFVTVRVQRVRNIRGEKLETCGSGKNTLTQFVSKVRSIVPGTLFHVAIISVK